MESPGQALSSSTRADQTVASDSVRAQPDTGFESDQNADAQDARVRDLLAKAKLGDERAWREIISLYARRVYALCKSRLRGFNTAGSGIKDDGHHIAEEITQSVFVTLATMIKTGGYQESGKFEPWLFRVAINRIRDEIRRVRRHAETMDSEAIDLRPNRSTSGEVRNQETQAEALSRHTQASDVMTVLRDSMTCLPDQDREVIELRHHAGMSFKQIAEMLDEPMGTLLARHHRALKKLKDQMIERRPDFASDPSFLGGYR